MAHGFNDNKSKANMPQIVANPSGSATDTLEKLSVDGVTYEVESGTEVIANPSEEASEDLTKLQIGNDVYNVSGGKPNIRTDTSWKSTFNQTIPANTTTDITGSITVADYLLVIGIAGVEVDKVGCAVVGFKILSIRNGVVRFDAVVSNNTNESQYVYLDVYLMLMEIE